MRTSIVHSYMPLSAIPDRQALLPFGEAGRGL